MPLTLYDMAAPVFVRGLTNMSAWLDKAASEGADEARLMESRLAEDMRPLPFQFQAASDAAKGAVARLTGGEAPKMADEEKSFAELKDRCRRTIDYINSVGRDVYAGADEREVVVKFPNGMGYRWQGAEYLTGFAIPNFFFHATAAYAILRANGVTVGKPDFLQHLGPPNLS